MIDDRIQNFIGAALDLQTRAADLHDTMTEPARAALLISLKNFSVAHKSLRDAASEALTVDSDHARAFRFFRRENE